MRDARRGIAVPAVLSVLVALGLFSALALFDAVQEWRVAGLAADQVRARAALQAGVDAAFRPPDLPLLCVSAPLARQWRAGTPSGGGSFRVAWWHLGSGLVRAEVEGRGLAGARVRAVALLRPDSLAREAGLWQCPDARRLVGAGPGWLTAHPSG